MAEGYYKPRKTLMTPSEIKAAQKKKTQKNKPFEKVSKPEQKNKQSKETKTPPVKPESKEKPKNITGGYSKRITYPKEEIKSTKESGGIQKGGGKIGGYIKPKRISYNSTKRIIWGLLIIFVVAVAFAVLYFTNSLNNLKIGDIGLKSQDLEMKISQAHIENDSLNLTLDIEPRGEELIGVKIIVDDGVNFDIFKVELTPEEIEKGEIYLELDKVNGDRINKILVSPITNTKEKQGVVGSVKESYIPKKTDFINQRDLNSYGDPQNIQYIFNNTFLNNSNTQTSTNESLNNQTNNNSNNQLTNQTQNQTSTNESLNNQTQENNQTQGNESEDQNTTDYSNCNEYSICYQEAVFEYNTCTKLWSLKQECTSEEVCIRGECVLRTDVVPECGNGILEIGEYCEEGNLAGETCESFGYFSGNLICNTNCAFDVRYCLSEDPNSECVPDCESKECGPDGCGEFCGQCVENQEECNSTGQCVPIIINYPCWYIENNECHDGNDEVTCDRDVIYTSLEECQENLEQASDLCWYIENNECLSGDDTAACNRDIIYSSSEACEQNLIPSECYPLETNEYICTKIEENDPGYDAVVQGETTCGNCINSNPGQVIQSEVDYYCKCLIPGGV